MSNTNRKRYSSAFKGKVGMAARREQARTEIRKMTGTFGGNVGRMPSREERKARR